MPGIAGILDAKPTVDRETAAALMVRSMVHETFYTSGTHLEGSLGFAGGWACHSPSYADRQPIWNETHNVCLIFAGENYADRRQIDALPSSDNPMSGAICLPHLYEELGQRLFEALNGTFSGLLLDLRENKAVLFNDRYGLGRIYYHEGKDGFYFASEAKSLLKVLPHLRQVDMRGLGELFVTGCTLQNRTLFPGISLLPPGALWTFRPGQPVEKKTYFSPATWENQAPLPQADYYEKLKATFTRILPRYFNGEQPVALSITGGLDSRMIIAGKPFPPSSLACYTFGGMYRECEDVKLGRLVANLCGQQHSVISVDSSFFLHYLDLAKRCVYITDGTMDVSGSVGLFVNRKARNFAPIRMTGNYGSEILRRHVTLKAAQVDDSVFSNDFRPNLQAAVNTHSEERSNCSRLSFIAFKQVPWFHYSRFAEEQSQLTIRAPYLDNELVPLAYQAPPGLLLNKQLAYRYTTDMQPALAAAPTDRGMLKRSPLLPAKVFQFWQELFPRMEYAYDYGMPQWLAKVDAVLAPLHLERLFLGRQKYYHFRTWYRHQLAGPVRDVLLDPRTLARPYLSGRRVETMVNAHLRGTGNYTLAIHKLMTSEMIERHLLAQS